MTKTVQFVINVVIGGIEQMSAKLNAWTVVILDMKRTNVGHQRGGESLWRSLDYLVRRRNKLKGVYVLGVGLPPHFSYAYVQHIIAVLFARIMTIDIKIDVGI